MARHEIGCDEFCQPRRPCSCPARLRDEQVIKEMNARGLGLAEMSAETLVQALKIRGYAMTDQQLREECERRFAGPVNEYTRVREALDDVFKVCAAFGLREGERVDLWLKETLEHAHLGTCVERNRILTEQRDALTRDRAEYIRRAEAAERQLEILTGPRGFTTARESSNHTQAMLDALRRQMLADISDISGIDSVTRGDVESGPGIDPRPDNSISHLPEDLLCDDE